MLPSGVIFAVYELPENQLGVELAGFDLGFFSSCLTGAEVLPEYVLDRQIFGDVRDFDLVYKAAAGADTFVSGSGIFSKGQDSDPNRYDSIIKQMRDELAQAR